MPASDPTFDCVEGDRVRFRIGAGAASKPDRRDAVATVTKVYSGGDPIKRVCAQFDGEAATVDGLAAPNFERAETS